MQTGRESLLDCDRLGRLKGTASITQREQKKGKIELTNNSRGLIMLGALKYLQLDYCCPSLVLVRLRLLFGS
jgi:hypothetical protein